MATETNYLIRCDQATAEYLAAEIKKIPGAKPRESDIKGIGGESEVIVFGAAALEAIKALLELIKTCVEARRAIKGIKVGDHEVSNPNAANIDALQKQISGIL
jgi:hypothetical protein